MASTLTSAFYRDQETTSSPANMSEEVAKLGDKCLRMVKHAEPVVDAWIRLYEDSLNYTYTNQLQNKRRKKGWPRPQINTIYPALYQKMSILAQRKPAIRARALRDDDQSKEARMFWEGDLQHRHDHDLRMQQTTIRATLDAGQAGWAIGYVWPNERAEWDDKGKRWRYKPCLTLVNPRWFGCDPNAATMEDCEFVYCKRAVPLDWAVAMWPKKAAELEAGADILDKERERDQINFPAQQMAADREVGEDVPGDLYANSETKAGQWRESDLVNLIKNSQRPYQSNQSGLHDSNVRYVVLTMVFFKDRGETKKTENEDYTDEELLNSGAAERVDAGAGTVLVVGDPDALEFQGAKAPVKKGALLTMANWPQKMVREWTEPDFPFGRFVIMAGKYVLNTKNEEQRWNRLHWPFEVLIGEPLPHTPRGLNMTEMARNAQDWLNVAAAHLCNWLMYFGDPRTVVEEGAMKKGSKLRSVAGAIVRVLKGGLDKVRREPPPPLAEGAVVFFDKMVRAAQDANRMHDQAMGAPVTGGQRTAQEVAILNQAMQIGMGIPMINMDDWIKRIMWHVAELDKEYLEVQDAVRMSGDAFTKERIQNFKEDFANLDFDIELEVGTALPLDTEGRKQDAIKLVELNPNNVMAKRNLLEVFNVKNKEEWLQADEMFGQFMAWVQQQQALAEQAPKQAAAGGPVAAGAGPQPVPPQAAPVMGAQ